MLVIFKWIDAPRCKAFIKKAVSTKKPTPFPVWAFFYLQKKIQEQF